jgi:hypothetical protein
MALKRLLHPTNRRVRYLVGVLLVGLFCIQCIPVGRDDDCNVVIAESAAFLPEDTAGRLVHLAETDHVALLEHCLRNYERFCRDYTCTLIKHERIRGHLPPQPQEVAVKFRESPFSVSMRWVRNAPIGDRVLYVEGKYRDQMLVRPKGLLVLLTGGPVFRKPDGAEAMKNTLRPVNLFGFKRGMRELLNVYRQARQAGDCREGFAGSATVEGRQALVLERYLPAKNDYPAWKTVIYIDQEYLVPLCIEGFDWDHKLSSRYVYRDLRFNVGLTDDDFLPEANDMKLPRR